MTGSGKADQLRALRERYQARVPGRLDDLEVAWRSASAAPVDDEPYALLCRLVHNLAGSAGSFGFAALGARARLLERALRAAQPGDRALHATLGGAMAELRALAARGPEPKHTPETAAPMAASPATRAAGRVFVLEDDGPQARHLVAQLGHFGYAAAAFPTEAAILTALETTSPVALVVDLELQTGPTAGADLVGRLQGGAHAHVPAVFTSAQDGWAARLAAVRAGGRAYLTKPIDVSALVEQLDRLTGRRIDAPLRILLVDDNEVLALRYAAVLEAAGMGARVLHDPAGLLAAFSDYQPDLVVMDVYMPGCKGTEAAQVIRQHPVHCNVPMVFLSTESAMDQQLAALRVGGDDFLTKPIADAHLVEAVRIRATRFRGLISLMSRDSLTGLLNHIHLKLALERELAMARRRGAWLSVVMLDIDDFKAVNDTYGHPVGDRVITGLGRLLTQRLRTSDIAARYGGEEFAVILPEVSGADAVGVIDQVREQFAQLTHAHPGGGFHVTLSAGVATAPPHSDVQSVLAAADAALYRAKRAGRNCVRV